MTFVKLLTVWFYKLNRNFINVVYESLQMYQECDFSADPLISVDLEIEMFSLEINTDQWLNDFLLFLLLSFTSLHNVFWNSFKRNLKPSKRNPSCVIIMFAGFLTVPFCCSLARNLCFWRRLSQTMPPSPQPV